MWAAIRYRRAQAVAVALLSTLITACAVFAPIYERSLEQSLLQEGLKRNDVIATAVSLDTVAVRDVPPVASTTRKVFPPELAPLYDQGSEMWSGRVRFTGIAGRESKLQVVGMQDTCRGLQVVSGACPTQAYQVLVSATEAKVQNWSIGTQLAPVEDIPSVASPAPFPSKFTIVGTFHQLPDPGHWVGVTLEGRAGVYPTGASERPLMDGFVTPTSTFASSWKVGRLSVTYLLDRTAIALDGLDRIPPAVSAAAARGLASNPSVQVRSAIPDLVSAVVEGQRQARTIVPLLMGQLALLAVVVLGLGAGAAVEQRRPELALARLRGRGARGAGRMLVSELGTIVALGVPVGFLLALGVNEVARRTWLTEGVPFELPATAFLAAAISLAVAILAVVVAARPTVREPISTLLRRVPPRRQGWAIGFLDAVVIAVAAAGVVTLASGNLAGPLALATPTLLALAIGLLLAHVLVPVADLVGRRMGARGRVVGGLTALQVARRPAVRRVMTIITVATALTVFAADAVVVGGRNREQRARVETGAEAVLTTSATDIASLRAAVSAVDPSGAVATPVVTVRQGDSTAMTTLAVLPDQFRRVAEFPRDPGGFDWAAITKPVAPEPTLVGRTLSVTVSDISLKAMLFQSGTSPGETPVSLITYLRPPGGQPFTVTVGAFPTGSTGPVTLTKDVDCSKGCRVTGFGLETGLGSNFLLQGQLSVGGVTMDGSSPVRLGDAAAWLPSGAPDAPKEQLLDYAKPVGVGDPTKIGMQVQSQRAGVKITSAASSASLPALVVGGLPPGARGADFPGAGLDGVSMQLTRAQTVPYAPGGGEREAIVNLQALQDRGSSISSLALAQVWLADPAAAPAVRAALAKAGLDVRSEARRADQQALFDNSASAWGLQLALVVGIVALIIAGLVLVLVAATSWRTRTRDYAALRMAGVTGRALRSVGLAEQGIVVLVSVLVGAVCGIVGAQLAMPILPFFTTPSTGFPVDTRPALAPIAAAAGVSLVLLLVVGIVVGARLVRRSTLDRVREQV